MQRLNASTLRPQCPLWVAGSTGHCNTACSLSAGVSNPKVLRKTTRGYAFAYGQGSKLRLPGYKVAITPDEKSIGFFSRKGCKGGIDLLRGTSVEKDQIKPERARSILECFRSDLPGGHHVGWIDQHRETSRFGQELMH